MKIAFLLSACLLTCLCRDLYEIFDDINNSFVKYNAIAAELSWETLINPGNAALQDKASANYLKVMMTWQQYKCEQLTALKTHQFFNAVQTRQTYLLCRGPKFTYREARKINSLYNQLQSIYYEVVVCIPQYNVTKDDHTATEANILDYLSMLKIFYKQSDVDSFTTYAANTSLNIGEGLCLTGENDFEKLMEKSKDPEVMKRLWFYWREQMLPMRKPYKKLVKLENKGAWRNGYSDIGASWREELEISDFRIFCRNLYSGIRPLYTLLHGVVRYYLRAMYGDIVPKNGAIPAHLLGSIWSHNWESLIDLITPKSIDLNESIKRLNWTVPHMVKRVEDFYQSMGLPAMTQEFWQNSVFSNKNGGTRCHGTAADMFKPDDYRLLYCSGTTMKDFSVLHHEFGHIHYYMAYADQPGLFRQANTALHESIGDAIMYGVMTPQHLHRLGLINDSILYTDTSTPNENPPKEKTKNKQELDKIKEKNRFENGIKNKIDIFDKQINYPEATTLFDDGNLRKYNSDFANEIGSKNGESIEYETEFVETIEDGYNEGKTDTNNVKDSDARKIDLSNDEILLLKLALNKIPQIPFALVIDEYRWNYFEGSLDPKRLNAEFWDLSLELQGIAPPVKRSEKYFDIGAKFHVPDNTPYIRYFLSSFIQHQIFQALCHAAVFGKRDLDGQIPDSIAMNRCDIYGSKTAGKLLKDIMSRGHSQHWREILKATTGDADISGSALQRYYSPLFKVLQRIVSEKNIPLGW